MTVSAQETIFYHVGNGVTVTFAYSCQVLRAADLRVYVNDVEVTSGFSVSGIGTLTGGIVTFVAPPGNLVPVRLEREVALERTTDYQQNGDFLARVVNPDFNRIWMALQQQVTSVRRVLRVPKSDPVEPAELPSIANRANRLLSFDAAGNPVAVAPSDQSASALSILLSGLTGAGLVGWNQLGIGAVFRFIRDKLRERKSVEDFGAVGDGVVDDIDAIERAIATYTAAGVPGTLRFTKPFYRISRPFKIPSGLSGMIIKGESPEGSYFITPNGSTFDIIRVAGAYCTITGFLFRPSGDQPCVHTYAPHTTIRGNRFLADQNNIGTAILTGDVDPDTAAFVPGAYSHTIEDNIIGVAGFAFARGIDGSSTAGMQALKIRGNQILSDAPISIPRGGGNTICENLLQSSTAVTGNGIDLGAEESGDMVYGNYIEGFATGILLRNLSNVNQVVWAVGNHYDGCTNKLTTLGTVNYVYENDGGAMTTRGWVNNYSSGNINRWQTPSGGEGFALSSAGLLYVNATSGTNHIINRTGVVEGDLLVTFQGSGNSASFTRHVTGTAANGARTAFSARADSTTGRSYAGGGTGNFSGADYAEYMVKWALCGLLGKGQIVGITAGGELTDKCGNAVAFVVKSTNPSIVGGDNWWAHLGERPELPEYPTPEHFAILAAYDAAHEEARARVDRIAFAGQVPVNVLGAVPGDYIVPVQDGDGIKGIAVSEAALTFDQYKRALGRVIAIEDDGRARIIVKVS